MCDDGSCMERGLQCVRYCYKKKSRNKKRINKHIEIKSGIIVENSKINILTTTTTKTARVTKLFRSVASLSVSAQQKNDIILRKICI